MSAIRNAVAPDLRPIAAWVAIAVAALIVWGSLFPFEFAWPTMAELQRRLGLVASEHATRSDLVANFLLYIPFGALCALAIGARARSRRIVRAAVIGAMLSAAIEITQLGTLHRVTSVIDLGLNTLGSLLGALLAVGYLAVGERWIMQGLLRARPAVVPFGLILLWLTADFAPFVPRFSWADIRESLGGFWLQPWSWRHVLFEFGSWCLLTECARRIWRLPTALLACLIFLAATIAARLLIATQHLMPQELVAWSSVCLAIALSIGVRNAERARWVAGFGLLALLAHELLPWSLSSHAQKFLWLPFSGSLLAGHNYHNLLEKIFIYSACLWSLALCRRRYWSSVVLMILGVGMIEILQIWVPSQEPEITDVLLVIAAAAAYGLLQRVQAYAFGVDSARRVSY
jgi:VanZ family protein